MKICFWGDMSGALKGRTRGGGELQVALIAKALVKGGHEVVVLDYVIAEEFQTCDGIKVYPVKGWNDGIRILRSFTHRFPTLYKCLKEQKADVYYCRIRDFRHIIVWLAARKVKAKFILALAEDLDVMTFGMRLKYDYLSFLHSPWGFFSGILNEFVYPFLIRKSDAVFVQHEGQKQMLFQKGIKSILLPNLIDFTQLPVIPKPTHDYFIYVGRLAKRKGVDEFLKIVEKTPFEKFIVVGQARNKSGYFYYDKLKTFQNVSLLGQLKHSETLQHIAYSKALISTSPMEGFPNIFIEAWAQGIPVISLRVDPGSIIEREKLGEFAHGDLERLLQSINNYKYSDEFAERAKYYVVNNHLLNDTKIEEISGLFRDLVSPEKS